MPAKNPASAGVLGNFTYLSESHGNPTATTRKGRRSPNLDVPEGVRRTLYVLMPENAGTLHGLSSRQIPHLYASQTLRPSRFREDTASLALGLGLLKNCGGRYSD